MVPIGVSHISLRLQKIQSREREEREQTNKRTICLGLTQSVRQGVMQHSAFPVCICRLTLAWISSETSTKLLGMPTYPHRSLCCPVSTGHSRHPSLTANFSVPLSHSLTGVPFLLPVTSRSWVQILCLVSRLNRQRDRLLGGPPT